MSDLPAVIQEIGPALRRRLCWAEVCMHAELADSSPRELRRILGGLPVARDVEEMIDRDRKGGENGPRSGTPGPVAMRGGLEETRARFRQAGNGAAI